MGSSPIIMLMGSSPMAVEAGQLCDHHAATAMDEVDGALTFRVVDSGMTSTFIVGTGQSTAYFVTNNVGTTQVVRRVVDTIDGCADRPCFPHSDEVESFICKLWPLLHQRTMRDPPTRWVLQPAGVRALRTAVRSLTRLDVACACQALWSRWSATTRQRS